jgi:hypothetical protein
MIEVIEDELKEVLHKFKKYKIPGTNGWTIDLFLGIYEIIGMDILKVVEESHINGHMHTPLNATFISLIPNTDAPQCLEDFRPISLCKCIYKVVSKIINQRIRVILSASLSPEKFSILKSRHVHEAIGVAQEALHSLKT